MGMRENLVPTVIVDKNNKTTTVYKKGFEDKAKSVLPGPDGEQGQQEPEPVPFLHSLFPSMKHKAAERADRKKHALLVKKLNKREKYAYTAETLKNTPTDRLQQISEIYDALPEGATNKVREGGKQTLFTPEMPKYHPFAIDVAHANREMLKREIPVDFMIEMFRSDESDGYRISSLNEHWAMDTALSDMKAGVDYTRLESLRQALRGAPEQFPSLLHLATVAINRFDTSDLKDADVPQRFLSFLNEWPDNEDRIIEHYREYGKERFTHEVLSGVLETHEALDDGWL